MRRILPDQSSQPKPSKRRPTIMPSWLKIPTHELGELSKCLADAQAEAEAECECERERRVSVRVREQNELVRERFRAALTTIRNRADVHDPLHVDALLREIHTWSAAS